MKKYLRAQELEVNQCSISYIRMSNMGAIQLMRKVPKEKMQDMRTFLEEDMLVNNRNIQIK